MGRARFLPFFQKQLQSFSKSYIINNAAHNSRMKQDSNACRRICGRMGLHGGAP